MSRPAALLALAASIVLLPACDREDPQRTAARNGARRDACIAEELFVRSRERLTTLEQTLAAARADNSPTAVITESALAFSRATHQYAEMRWRELALADSAAQAESREDSAAFAARAAAARPVAATGDVGVNAARDYNEGFAVARANPDHPCNQALRGAER
jgi:hypothetical protein